MTILLDNLCFAEGPRWRNGELWFSDMHDHCVCTVTPEGKKTTLLTLQDDEPSGLGWLPNGDLLVVSMRKRQLLRFDGKALTVHADLSALASHRCNDMVVDPLGRAYVGNFGFDLHTGEKPRSTVLIRVDPDGSAKIVDDDAFFPNGSVITADGRTLILAETFARALMAFDIDTSGGLSNKRIWAKLPEGAVPDGICLDSADGIWSASPTTNECVRQIQGGEVTHRIALERGAFACMIGGDHLYVLTASSSDPKACRTNRDGRIEVYSAPYTAAGFA
jgi:sugar lactone lactonase YvrE